MPALWQDVRFALRMLRRNPVFTLVAVMTLALALGANTAIFSVVNGVLLRPFSYEDPDSLYMVWERGRSYRLMVVSPPNFADWRASNEVFSAMSAWRLRDFALTGRGDPELVRGQTVSANLFSLLGVRPALGREFRPDEDEPGAPGVVILSHGAWQRIFDGKADAIGQVLTLAGENHTVIGVMPRGFDFPPPVSFRGEARQAHVEIWTPLRLSLAPGQAAQRGQHNMFVIARLKPGVPLGQAQAHMQAVAARLAQEFPATNTGWETEVVPLHRQVVGDVSAALWILYAAVGIVLLIACANVANLLLVRASARQRELAIRVAMGVARRRLMGQMLVETLMLSVAGAVIGVLLAVWGLRVIAWLAPANVYRLSSVSVDWNVAVFTLLLSAVTALAVGAIPAWHSLRIGVTTALKDGAGGASDGAGRQRLQKSLVVAEIALALVVLAGAGLLVKSFARLQEVPTGFRPEGLTAMNIGLPRASYPDYPQYLAFLDRLLVRVRALPMVEAAGVGDSLPLDTDRQGTGYHVEGEPDPPPGESLSTNIAIISPGYMKTMGLALLQGREFSDADTAERPPVVIVNRFFAERHFPGEPAVGRRITTGFHSGVPVEIVGVASDERHDSLQEVAHPIVYLPFAQTPNRRTMTLLVRSAADPGVVAAAVRAQVSALDPQLPVYDVKVMTQVVTESAARPRFMTVLVAAFGGIAVLLAAIGLYGVMSYTVARRTRELGIRVALGAGVTDVVRLVLRQGLWLALAGTACGLLAAFALTRLLTSLLFEVTATDPVTFAAVSALLLGIALVASYLPARRAARFDPLRALRTE